MKSKPVLIAMCLLPGAVGLVGWHFLQKNSAETSASVASARDAANVAAQAQPKAVMPVAGKHSQPASRDDDDRPFAEVRPNLEQQARAGDGHAAWRLGMTLAKCNGYVPVSDEKLEQLLVDAFARGMTVEGSSAVAAIRRLKLAAAQKRLDCRNVSGLNESDANNAANIEAFRWMELGASLGNADAQAMYAALAFESFDQRNALADAELIRERKQVALNYLERSLAQGDALALQLLFAYHTDGMLFPADAELAYSYLFAFSLTPRAADFVPGYLELALEMAAEGLDPIAQERAQQNGRSLATCCTSGVRGQQ